MYELAVDLTTPGNENLTATEQADLINDLLNAGGITFTPADDFDGTDPADPNSFNVTVTSTEEATGADVLMQSASVTDSILVVIIPSSAAPSASPSAFGDSVAPGAVASGVPSSAPSSIPSTSTFPLILTNGTIELVEDVASNSFGSELIDSIDFANGDPFDVMDLNDEVSELTISDIPVGTTFTWDNGNESFTATPGVTELVFTNLTAPIGDQIDDLTIEAPDESDEDFTLSITLVSTQDIVDDEASFPFDVIVDADADEPLVVSTTDIVVEENTAGVSNDAPVNVTIASSADDLDESEDLTVTFDVPELVSQPGVFLGELDADLTASGEPAGTFTFVDNLSLIHISEPTRPY